MEQTLTEFLKLAEESLGHRIDESTRRSLRQIQKDYLRRQRQLVRTLDVGAMTPEEYLAQLNALLKAVMERMRVALGEERFIIVFGDAGRHPESLVDRSTFIDAIASERAALR
jgi:hypothetical protein